MRKLWNFDRDANYYLGLLLLMLLPITLLWEFLKYSFNEPSHFPIYLMIYGFGYLLLVKSDFSRQINSLEEEIKKLSQNLNSNVQEPEELVELPPLQQV